MSEPLTSTKSKPESGGEQTVDLCPSSPSDSLTPYVGKSSEQPEDIRLVPIYQRPDLLVPCADLVNSEWQRSQAARVHSLQKSCPEFPVCLVLLQGHKERERLLGHARLSRVVGHDSSLFVETVVVSKAERGRGFGRTLMEETERYAKRRGFKRLCLTTHDKQHFYAHIGYVLSTPVQNAGSMTTFVPMEMLLRISSMPSEDAKMQRQKSTKADVQVPRSNGDAGRGRVVESLPPSSLTTTPPIPPPPAPPPLPPVPPLSIPPPPPLPQSVGQRVAQTLTETLYKDAKGLPIYWMHKDI